MTRILLLLLLLYSNAMAWEKCNVEVEWQCTTDAMPAQNCTESLDEAIALIKHQEASCQHQLRISIILYSPSEKLSSNVMFFIANFSHVAITSPNGTRVQCNGKASLGFNGEYNERMGPLMDIHIENITFLSCGPGIHETVPAALFFNNNCQIQINHTQVDKSNGVGLAMVNVVGTVTVGWSIFTRNKFRHGFGGGVHLTIDISSNKIEFIHCVFKENQVSLLEQNRTHGGGMYIEYRKGSQNGTLEIKNCLFSKNDADLGGGLMATFSDNACNNSLHIESTSFVKNSIGLHYNDSIAGAGAAVTIYSNAMSNKVYFKNCHFTGNVAPWGGGLWIFSAPDSAPERPNSLKISGCMFKNNSGHIGAALYIYCSSPASSPQSCNSKPVIAQSSFIQNNDLSMPLASEIRQSPHSIVYIRHFPTSLSQMLKFSNNDGTPLHVHETSVTLQNNTVLSFTENIGWNGGAIMLYGSLIVVSENITLLFSKNKAKVNGGAIYSYMTEEEYLPYSNHCFIESIPKSDPRNWKINVTLNQNTVSGKLNAIYATSVLPCVQRSGSSLDEDIRQTFCMWKNWNFGEDSCTDQILTSPRNFSSTLQNMAAFPGIPSQSQIHAVDDYGHIVNYFNVHPTVLHPKSSKAYVTNKTLTVFGSINTNVSIQLELEANRRLLMTVNVSLEHCPPGFQFDPLSNSCICEFTRRIYCEYDSHSRWIAYILAGQCMTYSTIKINGRYEKNIVFGQCAFTVGLRSFSNHSHQIPYLSLPLEKNELDTKLCGELNRTGILCGKCVANLSIDLLSSSFNCYNCSGSFGKWLIYITGEGIPPLIFFVLVLVLHISLTSGPLNGYIFFSQTLCISVEIALLQASWHDSSARPKEILSGLMVTVYSIWSLDFFRLAEGYYHICLGPHVKVMHVWVLRYLSALYPLCFLVIAYIVIELHARNCRVLVRLWKPLCFMCARFRQVWKARTSIIDAFAAFILLSYVKTARISLLLLTFTRIFVQDSKKIIRVVNYDPTVTYLSSEHVPFWCIAAACLLSFGLVPPVLLTFYQFKFFQKCLYRCKLNGIGLRMFMDAFQGCYKDGKDGGPDRRYFAGIYFIFRLVIFAIFDLADTLFFAYTSLIIAFVIFGVITAILQPYKKPFFTYLDIFFFNLLAIIIALQYLALFLKTEVNSLPVYLLYLTYTLIFTPFMYVCLFVFYWVCRRAPKHFKRKAFLAVLKLQNYFPFLPGSTFGYVKDYCSVLSNNVGDDIPEYSFRYRSF